MYGDLEERQLVLRSDRVKIDEPQQHKHGEKGTTGIKKARHLFWGPVALL